MEVEVLQQAHTVKVKTVSRLQTMKVILSLKMLQRAKRELSLKLSEFFCCLKRQVRQSKTRPPLETFKKKKKEKKYEANTPKKISLFTL